METYANAILTHGFTNVQGFDMAMKVHTHMLTQHGTETRVKIAGGNTFTVSLASIAQ